MQLGVPKRDDFKAKSQSSGLPFHSLYSKYTPKNKRKAVAFTLFLAFIYFFFISPPVTPAKARTSYPAAHGLYEREIPTKLPYIFPLLENAPVLRELGLKHLFRTKIIHDPTSKTDRVVYDFLDDDLLNDNNELSNDKKQEDAAVTAKKAFAANGRKVFTGSSPEIVIVTAVDFDKYELSGLTKVVQNRVDYAKKHNYGVYVRWFQEFTPLLQHDQGNAEWVRVMITRAAMHAFPEAKYFWFLDQDSLIMRYEVNLYDYILGPAALEPIMVKDQPIIPLGGVIKTFSHIKADQVSILFTQLEQKVETDSFVVKNDVYGKAFLEFWMDPLYRSYSKFPEHQDSALSHILQWHPLVLSRTALIPPRTISSLHTYIEVPKEGDTVHYVKGDLVVVFRDCAKHQTCQKDLEHHWKVLVG